MESPHKEPYPTSLPLIERPEPGEKFTERDLLDRLYQRHATTTGNGPQWAYMEHVGNQPAWADRTIDALAIHLWPSRQHEVHAYEVKVSRADFRREVAEDCGKSACWREWVEFFWIVAPAGVVPLEELPADWGLLETSGATLRIKRRATRLRDKPSGYMPGEPIPRGMVSAMLRAQVRTASKVDGYWRSLRPPTDEQAAKGRTAALEENHV